MKKLYILLLLSFYMASCQKGPQFKLQADLESPAPDTLWIIYDTPTPRIDTICTENGSFTYTTLTDTLQIARLLSPGGESLPIFISPQGNVRLKGTLKKPIVEGDGDNGEYGKFLQALAAAEGSVPPQQTATQFIQAHPHSYASAYIINQYFIQNADISTEKLRSVIAPLDGNVKDCYLLSSILKRASAKDQTNNSSEYVSYFSSKGRNGQYVSWNSTANSYTLINFWASWDRNSVIIRDSLASLKDKFPEKQFRVLNISLDYEKSAWLDACKQEDEQWIEVCDYKAWESMVIKQNQIQKIPANILVDRNRKIVGKNLYDQELSNKLKELKLPDKKP